MMPDFIIIGAMKCATSTLHDQLVQVPGVSMSDPKEPNFFSDESNWAKGMGWYQSLFASMPPSDLKGESSTHYTKLPTYPACAQRLHEHLPEAKLIYVMRDPVDRIVSQYIHEWSQRVIPKGCSIDDAITRYPVLVEYSRYAQQLEPYIERYGTNAILPVFYERLIHQPQPEFERLARFLGIQSSVRWQDDVARNISSTRLRRSPTLSALLSVPAFQALRRAIIPDSVRARVRSHWAMKERPRLDQESVQWLHEQLDPDIARLGEWLGRPLSCACFAESVKHGDAPEWDREGDS
ncbi:MAG: sulfotransferase [Phycisphaerae bacterium]|nr:sulfotransferase [Phycisphaerae bacterium]MBM91463.1 sulfotransferase [Phycisphaerae bacterium]MBM92668.1 sulfotransferase [Phycisphaerae bacterium]